MKTVYVDNNATTKVAPEVVEVMLPYFSELYGNPSSMHFFGGQVQKKVDEAREKVADFLGAEASEVVFTSCGTESDNAAILGTLDSYPEKRHLITTRVEHPAVGNLSTYLGRKGYRVTELSVDREGRLDLDELRESITEETTIVTIMYANNETGNVLPIHEIGSIAREHDIIFHSDMVQAMGKIDIDMESLNVDLASFAGHKVYAPKGVGVLYVREGLEIDNLIHGGHQEGGRRAGTENVIGAVVFGKACEVIARDMFNENKRIEGLRQRLLDGILERIDHVRFNGHPTRRLPNTLNLSFEFVKAESLLIALDLNGIAVSSGSACSSGSTEPSHVLLAMSIPAETCQSAIRLSLGRSNTEEDIDYTLSVLPDVVARFRAMSPLYKKK